jgi:CP family cyanate transporter-like MFS transporter
VISSPRSGLAPIAVAIVLTALNMRTMVNSVGPVLAELISGLGLSSGLAGLVTAMPVLCFAALGYAGPPLSARFRDTRVLACGMLLMAAGLGLRAMAGSIALFLAGTVLAMSGGALGNVLLPGLVKRYFPHRIGLMVGAYGAAMALGAAVASIATPALAAATGAHGWRWGLGVWAVFALAAALPWLAVPCTPAPRERITASGSGPFTVLRSPTAVALTVLFGLQGLQGYVVLGWSAQYLRESGLDAAGAGVLLAVHALVSVPLGAVVPALTVRQAWQRPLLLLIVGSSAVGWTGMALAPLTVTWLWMVLLALSLSAFPMCLTLLGLRTRGPEATQALATTVQGCGYLLMSVGPLGVGVLRGLTDDYTGMFGLAAVVVIGLLISGWWATRPRYVEDEMPDRPRAADAWVAVDGAHAEP